MGQYRIYWSTGVKPLFGASVDTAHFKDTPDLLEALKICETLRAQEKAGEPVSHITMIGKPDGMVGDLGVGVLPPDYNWKKRR